MKPWPQRIHRPITRTAKGPVTGVRTVSIALLLCTALAIILAPVAQAAEVVTLPHPEEPLPNEKVVVWSPLFQAAWDGLHHNLGKPINVAPPNALMERLDSFQWSANEVMPPDRWKVWSGNATRELIDQANAEAARITGEAKGSFTIEPNPNALMALGLLDRDLAFKKAFPRSVRVPLHFLSQDGTKSQVQFFGTRGKVADTYRGFVKVLAYQRGIHAIEIASDADDTVVLYLGLPD